MDPVQLNQKEDEVTQSYQDFLAEVRQAFDRHCDQIRAQAEKKLAEVPEGDEETRKNIMDEEQAELDRTLTELKELLAKRELQVRQQLEEIETMREQGAFDFESELAQVGTDEEKHAA